MDIEANSATEASCWSAGPIRPSDQSDATVAGFLSIYRVHAIFRPSCSFVLPLIHLFLELFYYFYYYLLLRVF